MFFKKSKLKNTICYEEYWVLCDERTFKYFHARECNKYLWYIYYEILIRDIMRIVYIYKI